ncbi:hypothetical protein IJZ97_03245 [bacterium]|nr:hypothetical protein [bacterium]
MKKLFAIIFILFLFAPISFGKTKANYDGMGYVGTLPDVTKSFEQSEPKTTKPVIEHVENFHSASQIKPAPRDNPSFVNIILKQDKTTQYVTDINEFIPMLEKIYDSIESKENVQLFNAKIYFFNKNADYFRSKYAEKPEGEYISFKKLMEVSTHAKSIALLRAEAEKYNPYLAYGGAGYIYDPNNINEQLDYLKTEVERIIMLLKEVN